MPINLLISIKMISYLVLIVWTIYILYIYFIRKDIKLNRYSLFLTAIMYSRQNISVNLNSVWAEDGLYFTDLKVEGFSSIFSNHNGYQQIAYRAMFIPATFLPITVLPIYIMILCCCIYFVLIRELMKIFESTTIAKFAPYIVFAFVWFPLSPYEALGNVNNIATYLLILFFLMHLSFCYRIGTHVIHYTLIAKILALILALSSPALFISLGFSLILMVRKKKRLPKLTIVYLLILCSYNLFQFISLTESRFNFTFKMLPGLLLDGVFRLVFSPIAGKLMPDLPDLFQIRNFGIALIFLIFALNFAICIYFKKTNVMQHKGEVLNIFIAVLGLTTPSLLAEVNAQSYLLLTDQYYRLPLLAPGKFSSVSFLWIFLILVSAQYLSELNSRRLNSKSKSKIVAPRGHRQNLITRVVPVMSLLGVLTFILFNSHSTGGRLPSNFSEDVHMAIRLCNSMNASDLSEIPIAPYDGNWKMRIRCDQLH